MPSLWKHSPKEFVVRGLMSTALRKKSMRTLPKSSGRVAPGGAGRSTNELLRAKCCIELADDQGIGEVSFPDDGEEWQSNQP